MSSIFLPSLILASQSPRRDQILRMLGFNFKVQSPNFEEIIPADMDPFLAPEYLAKGKALSLGSSAETLVLGADTLVFLDHRPLGKPDNAEHAFQMLSELNGKTHQVITGVALAKNGTILASGSVKTEVTFANVSEKVLRKYANSSEPLDKAGSYAIQGKGVRLVESVQGCFYNVMGLPIQLTLKLLDPFFSGEL